MISLYNPYVDVHLHAIALEGITKQFHWLCNHETDRQSVTVWQKKRNFRAHWLRLQYRLKQRYLSTAS